ncbi:hypothetical protein SAMN04488038_101311 [Solimonas aquatica]|uniref:Uncharacterized protein n=1 Tax=Solimonas aquatica TaxID=489703 RepID=A0A1H9A881_9GAMM|nr:hypothetical protein [Solimonas aquatica]SEP72942.1 hypothetical protein SAMN04488038_101311 [Solimonas aquatica]
MDHRQDDSAPTVDAPNSDGLVPDFSNKVVPLRPWTPPKAQERLDPRLEELRRILAQAKPVAGEHSDDEVIRDEDRFRRRFGPGFRWNRRDRIGLIALKKRYDLTDPEIKLFQHTGNLRRTPFGVILTASPWVALWGSAQIAVFGFLFLVLLLAAWPKLVTAPAAAIKPALALLGLLAFCVGLYWLYVKPWLLRRRKERERGDQAS